MAVSGSASVANWSPSTQRPVSRSRMMYGSSSAAGSLEHGGLIPDSFAELHTGRHRPVRRRGRGVYRRAVIKYSAVPEHLGVDRLDGFFVGWPSPPSTRTHLALLKGSAHAVLAWDGDRVVGFVTALSDGVLMASVPLLEVLPSHQGKGIGRALVRRVLAEVGDLYQVQLCCDDDVLPFYQRLGFARVNGMIIRPARAT